MLAGNFRVVRVITAGILFGWAVQFISKIKLEESSFGEVMIHEWGRLSLSGLAGGLLFYLLQRWFASLRNDRLGGTLSRFLEACNLYLIFFLLQSNSLILFLTILSVALALAFVQRNGSPVNSEHPSAPVGNFLIAVFILAYFTLLPLIYSGETGVFSLARAVGSLSLLALPVLFLRKGKRVYISLMALVLFAHGMAPLYHLDRFGCQMPTSLYFEIMISPWSELGEYLGVAFELKILPWLLALLAAPVILILMISGGGMKWGNNKGYMAVSMCTLFTFGNNNYSNNVVYPYYQNFYEYRSALELYNKELAARAGRNTGFAGLKDNNPGGERITYVCIIGEATGRNHMGLYGYHRPTNPMLSNIKKDLYVFTDVISPHSHTRPSMEKIISFANFEDMTPFYKEGSLIELFRQAGFRTYWLSNQHKMGVYENVTSAVAQAADLHLFVNDGLADQSSYDEKLLLPLRHVLEEDVPKKFIVLHLMGTHADYTKRYPGSFNYFTSAGDIKTGGREFLDSWAKGKINEYDNAVRYNDKVVYEIIDLVKKKAPLSYVLYFPDHGEEVYDCRPYFSHQEANATAFMFEIPFIAWFSEGYKARYPSKTDPLPTYLHRKYQCDDVIHSIVDISNLTLERYQPSRSIFHPSFKEEKRIMSNGDYDSLRTQYDRFREALKIGAYSK